MARGCGGGGDISSLEETLAPILDGKCGLALSALCGAPLGEIAHNISPKAYTRTSLQKKYIKYGGDIFSNSRRDYA